MLKLSAPLPPVKLSLPNPPSSVSFPVPPLSESASADPVSVVAVPVLLNLNPVVPAVMAARFTALPLVVTFAVPELPLAELAVHAAPTVAFTVAPALTTNTSAPPTPRSLTVSVPAPILKLSAPSPPLRLSLPPPPSSVSAPAPPLSVSLFAPPVSESACADPVKVVAAPLLLRLNPDTPPVIADRSTAYPLDTTLAVPELLLAEVAVHAAPTVAFTVAPALTTSTSAPPSPRSLTVSVPAPMLKVSAPPPPAKASLPAPPEITSLACPPVIVEAPVAKPVIKNASC